MLIKKWQKTDTKEKTKQYFRNNTGKHREAFNVLGRWTGQALKENHEMMKYENKKRKLKSKDNWTLPKRSVKNEKFRCVGLPWMDTVTL